jgi:hypothetical protein
MYAMPPMVRKQVYIEARQDRLLKERASQYRVTEAELIRQAIDGTVQPGAQAVDPAAWAEIERYIAGRKRRIKPRKAPRWSRESLHGR